MLHSHLRSASHARAASVALAALVLGSACIGGAHAPDGPPKGTLALGKEADARAAKGAFAVVFGAPQGPQIDPPEVSLVFNRPMAPLELAGNEAPPPVKMTPEVKGRWQWVGTNALSFLPEVRLPRATDFVVEVPQGTRALSGETLEKPFKLQFSTARPQVLRVDAGTDSFHLAPDSKFTLWLNQPIDAAELKRAMSITAGDEPAAIPFDVKPRDADNDLVMVLTPAKKLPLGETIKVAYAEDLRGKEGPLTAGKAGSFEMHTYGPFAVEEVSCNEDTPHGRCSSDSGLSITLSNEVSVADLKKAVKVEPPVDLRWPSWMSDEDTSSHFYLYGAFKPGRHYKLTIAAAGLKDEYQQPLQGDFAKALDFDDLWATAEIGVAGTYAETGATNEIPVYVVNAHDVEMAVAPLPQDRVVTWEDQRLLHGTAFEHVSALPKATTKSLAAAGVNQAARHTVKIADVLGKDGHGPLAIAIRYTERPGTRHARSTSSVSVVQATDLAISAKVSPEGSLVWVTRLSNGAPVAGATVEIRDKETEHPTPHTTDKDGFVKISDEELQPKQSYEESSVIVVKSGDDWSYRPVRDVLEGYRYGAPFRFDEEEAFGLVFTDAGVYRPGDTVHLKGIVREPLPRGTKTPAGRTVTVHVQSSDGQKVADVERKLSAFGTFDAEVQIPPASRLGTYEVWTNFADDAGLDANTSFEVAEYRPAEFKVGVETDRPSYVRGESIACTARGDYLYGAPMSKASAHVTLTRGDTGFVPPNTDGFEVTDEPYAFDLPDTSPARESISSTNATLDAKGATVVKAALTMPGQRGPESVLCEAEVSDLSRQAVAGRTSAIVHPGEFYLALRATPGTFLADGDTVKPEVFAVDPKGAKVAGKSVKIDLIQRSWAVARQKTGRGDLHRVSTPVDKVAASCSLTTGASPVSCSLKPPSAGYYLLRATSEDGHKNAIAASESLYVTGSSSAGWRDADDNHLGLVADKASYAVGQTAKILIKSPFPSAEALVTVERAGVYSVTRTKLVGAMPQISIPITEDLRPNAFVGVLLLRGRSKAPPKDAKGADVGAPAFRYGATEIKIDPEARRLAVKLTPDAMDKRPGQELSVGVDVRDRQGKPARAEVTLYAVDEGVLSLVAYETPDPVKALSEPRPLHVATIESRESLARTYNPYAALGLDKGRDGGDGASASGISVRRDFRTSAYFQPALVTDANGHADARFKLPESLTTYRIMAVVAAEDDRFGYAASYVTTSRPLMARPALPRFLRAGDKLDAGVIVTTKGMAKASVDVEAAADGLAIQGPAKKSVDVEPGQPVEVRFAMAAPRVGAAKLRFSVRGGGEEDRVEVTRTISPPLSLEAVALYGDTTGQSVEQLGDMSAIRDDVGNLSVDMSSTALVGLDAGVEQLIEYPYGCTEQLTSRLVPLLPLRDLARDYGFPLPKNVDAIAAEAVAKILTHQRGDGGFGMWAESETSSPWLTAYALWGLDIAAKRGVAVPKDALGSAARYLRDSIESIATDPWARAAIPFILDVLAERGEPDVGRASAWFEFRKQIPIFAQAQLLHAMAVGKGDRKAMDTLASELEASLRLDGPAAKVVSGNGDHYAFMLDSDTRSTALVLRALIAAQPDHPLASKLVYGLLGSREGGTWRSTQETAWALLALDDYRRAQEKKEPSFLARVFLGQSEIGEHRFEGRSLTQSVTTVPASQVVTASGAQLGFSVDGSGKLFYQARLRYAKKELPAKPLDRGFFVTKTLRAVKPEDLSEALKMTGAKGAAAFNGGDLVLADVVVITPDPRDFVVVDDPLPAGFEAIDARLRTSAVSLDVDRQDDSDEDGEGSEDDVAMGRAYFGSDYVREVRDDRVLFFVDHMAAGMYRYRYLARATTNGAYVLPPTRAEEMYAPEVFGRTAAGSIAITPK
jgi:hypothetical protein